jgi:hypothetical protein
MTDDVSRTHIAELRDALEALADPIEEEEDFFALEEHLEAVASALAGAFRLPVGEAPSLEDVLERLSTKHPSLRPAAELATDLSRDLSRLGYYDYSVLMDDVETARSELEAELGRFLESLVE